MGLFLLYRFPAEVFRSSFKKYPASRAMQQTDSVNIFKSSISLHISSPQPLLPAGK